MDSSTLSDTSQMSAPGTPSRKRARENETPSQKHKREQAAERQRRKRLRDRSGGLGMMVFNQPGVDHQQMQGDQSPQVQGSPSGDYVNQELTPEETARRERVRAAARERQRKHRLLVKQRKMRELGIDMGNEMMPGMDEAHFRNADGQYPVLPHDLQAQAQAQANALNAAEPPFPQGQPHGGQTFATTLLLSFSCAPLLKQHLLRTLNMTNEELASLEPIIAEAWDHWDHQRRLHYDQQAGGNSANHSPYPVDMNGQNGAPNGHPFPPPPGTDPASVTNEFQARFRRAMVAPSPFQAASTPTSTSGDQIDPHLATGKVEGR